jgi:hypothetical protein
MIAMRGAGHMYGIITKYTLRAYPIGKVLGGYRIFSTGKRERIYAAYHEFINNPNPDPKAAIIVNSNHCTSGMNIYMIFFFYDGEKHPPGAFGKMYDIPATLDFCTTRTYTDLMMFNSRGVDLLGSRASFRTITLSFMEKEPAWYSEIEDTFTNITEAFQKSHYTSNGHARFSSLPFHNW